MYIDTGHLAFPHGFLSSIHFVDRFDPFKITKFMHASEVVYVGR